MLREFYSTAFIGFCFFLQAFGVEDNITLTADNCAQLTEAEYLDIELPLTALASFQGSGNTWVRQVLAGATGYKTGDVYQSYGDDRYPEFSAAHNQSVIAIKTHTYSVELTRDYGFKRALLIVRNPLDALYSEFNRMYGGNKTGYADAVQLVNKDGSLTWKWATWMTHVSGWLDFYTYWLKYFKGQTHIIYYNNLKLHTHSELTGAIRFLGLEPDMHRLGCTVQYPKPSYFKRPAKPPPVSKRKLFTRSMSKAKKAVQMFKDLVVERFGENSELYERLDLDISVEELR